MDELASPPLPEMSDEEWEAQLADLIRRDPDPDALPDEPWPDDDPWLEHPQTDAGVDPATLSDAAIIDTIAAVQRHLNRAGARQARLLAEFTTRRPTTTPITADTPRADTFSRWAPDEISLTLSMSRITALNQLAQAVMLPAVLDAWEHGALDVLKVRAICDACLRVPVEKATQVAARVLPRAAGQTLAQLRASLKRAVIAVDPDGANQRHREVEKKRRVNLYPDEDGMATLSAYLTAPQAMTAYGWLTALARGLGKNDPRPMDARRADLFSALLSGNLTTVAPTDNLDEEPTATATTTTTGSGDDRPSSAGETTATTPGDNHRPDSTDTTTSHDNSDDSNSDSSDDDSGSDDGLACDAAANTDDSAASSADSETTADGTAAATRLCARCGTGSAPAAGHAPRASSSRPGSTPPNPPPAPAPRSPAAIPQPVHPGKPLVHVLVPITTLYGADQHPVELVGYGPIPAALARDIAADSIWKRLVTDPLSGTLLDHGRTTYRPPTATAEFIRARDIHCRFPTCRRRALDSELDHTQAWTADHGDTNDDNLYDACPHHHHVKHDGPGWTVSQDPDATITWTTPTGHRYSSRPYDYRPEPALPNPARTAAPTEPERPEPDLRSPFDRDPDADDVDDAPPWSTRTSTDTRPPRDNPPTHPIRPAHPTDPALQRNLRRITRADER